MIQNIESGIYKPFALPTQINNIGMLILAYVVYDTNQQTQCSDPDNMTFLYFILYGSIIVYGFTLLFSVLYSLGAIDKCVRWMNMCGEVFLTINTLGIFVFGAIYHVVAMVYGMVQLLIRSPSECVELEIFRRVNGMIYTLWVVLGLAYLGYFFLNRRNRTTPATDVLLNV